MARNTFTASLQDLIVAPATAAGAAAVAIVRLSGPGAVDAASRLFSVPLAEPGRLVLGTLRSPDGDAIDRCLAVIWRAPRSFTGEDMAEFHLHGSPAVVAAALDACRAAGARIAQPGEFTRRAFLHGKLDLAQAEAVAALTAARTDDARRAALGQLSGGLSARLGEARQALVRVTAELEASIDFPDEDVPAPDRHRLLGLLDSARAILDALLSTWDRGRRLTQGARVVLAGEPNAGKSSLFNALLGRERAIVTPHPGTTRDSLEATVDLRGVPVTLVDTAGLREAAEEIEAAGIARSHGEIASADLVLFVVDATAPSQAGYAAVRDAGHLVVMNKSDLAPSSGRVADDRFLSPRRIGFVACSALSREGLDALEEAIADALGARADNSEAILTSARHAEALTSARTALLTASEALASAISAEFIVVDLAAALSEIDRITGRQELDEEILDAIFSTFCLGK